MTIVHMCFFLDIFSSVGLRSVKTVKIINYTNNKMFSFYSFVNFLVDVPFVEPFNIFSYVISRSAIA